LVLDTAKFTGLPDINGYSISQYQWRFDDGSRDTALSASRLFLPGDHPVGLQTVAANGCLGDTSKIITTYSKPVAGFGFEKAICAGEAALIRDSSTISEGGLREWRWNFANGQSGNYLNGDDFFHQYNTPGRYEVSLVVVSDRGCISDSAFRTLEVNMLPEVNITYTGKLCSDSSIVFIPEVTTNGNTLTGGWWDFGDGQQQTVNDTAPVIHTYPVAGSNFTVKFVVQAGSGCTSDTAIVHLPFIRPAAEASFTYSAGAYCENKPVQFTYTGSSNIQNWEWDFGNGSSAAAAPLSHRYTNSGEYSVSLRVTSTDGCGSAPFNRNLRIYATPAADAGPTIVKLAGAPARIMASLPDTGVFTYQWTPAQYLDDASLLKPVTSTPADQLYTLKVTGGPGNCEATDTVRVTVLRNIFIPNAFTPDGNGRNDLWNITGINNNPSALVSVYNRWGQLIYESRGYTRPWDGTFGGKPQPAGAYYYVIRPDVNKPATYSGYVMLLR
jgi:gliding motility-associated-like protein